MFEKGQQKTGGRRKGTPNKRTAKERNLIRTIVEKELKAFPRLLCTLETKDRLLIVTRLMPFVYAKKQEISVQEETQALLSNIQNLNDAQLLRLKEIISECMCDE